MREARSVATASGISKSGSTDLTLVVQSKFALELETKSPTAAAANCFELLPIGRRVSWMCQDRC